MLATPHDTFFKVLFSQSRHAAELLRVVLPRRLAERIDWSTLKHEPGSFIDEELQSTHADLLFTARMGDERVQIYLLFEHQSTFDPWMQLRLLRYMVRIWEAARQAAPNAALPVILPVVLHHGEEPWRGSTEFAALFPADADASPFVPQFRFALADLATVDPVLLRERIVNEVLCLALNFLQAGRSKEPLVDLLRDWKKLQDKLRTAQTKCDEVGAMLRYLFEIRGSDEFAVAMQALEPEFKTGDPEMETIADMLRREGKAAGRQEGRQEGLEEGLEEGQRKLLLLQLAARFGEVPETARRRLAAAGPAELQDWAVRLLTAGSLAQLLDG